MEEMYLEDGQVEITHRFEMYKHIRLIVVSYLFLYIGLLICILECNSGIVIGSESRRPGNIM